MLPMTGISVVLERRELYCPPLGRPATKILEATRHRRLRPSVRAPWSEYRRCCWRRELKFIRRDAGFATSGVFNSVRALLVPVR